MGCSKVEAVVAKAEAVVAKVVGREEVVGRRWIVGKVVGVGKEKTVEDEKAVGFGKKVGRRVGRKVGRQIGSCEAGKMFEKVEKVEKRFGIEERKLLARGPCVWCWRQCTPRFRQEILARFGEVAPVC